MGESFGRFPWQCDAASGCVVLEHAASDCAAFSAEAKGQFAGITRNEIVRSVRVRLIPVLERIERIGILEEGMLYRLRGEPR